MQHENVLKTDLLSSIDVIDREKNNFNIEKVTTLLDTINELLKFCLNNLVKDGRIRVRLIDIPKVWKAAKKFVEDMLQIWPQFMILRKLDNLPLSIGSVLVSYLIWAFQNIIKNGKVKVGLLDIIPFIVRTIKMIKEITSIFKSKGLFNV